jgi:PhzF family phenazine biosynthesis protein
MPRTIQVHQVDAFTRIKFTGNPAGVVLEADALTDAEMLAIARELNNADTAFVLKADAADHDLRVRFFTPRTEAAFVGHASVAAHYVLSATASHDTRRVRQKSRAGIVEVEIRGSDAQRRIAIRQSPPALGREINDRERLAVMDALALASHDLDLHCPVQVVGTSSTRLMVGVRGAEQLRQLKPDVSRLTTLSAQLGAQGFFVFTLAPELPEVLTESRMFCPALGIAEDPVSGNAHGMLGVYLARHRLLGPTAERVNFAGAQGHHVHRPGRVEIELEFRDEEVAGVWIVGQATAIFETQISL